MPRTTLIYPLIGIAFAGALVWYLLGPLSQQSIMFSPIQTLNVLFQRYTAEYLEPGTNRTMDKDRNNITTSEGQSYTMLRAVWLGDKEMFDKS
jgi:endo-1,4-beta-D-glucanase Y